MERKYLAFPAEIKTVDDGEDGTFTGYGSVFGNVDAYNEIVEHGAFSGSLKKKGLPALLWQHDPSRPIGVYTDAKEDDRGLSVKGQLNLETQQGREAHSLLKQGALKGLSIGFFPIAHKDNKDGTRSLTEVELLEVSLVTFPANESANVVNVRHLPKTEREMEEFLRKAGYSRDQSKAIVRRGFDGYLNTRREADDEKILTTLVDQIDNFNQQLKGLI